MLMKGLNRERESHPLPTPSTRWQGQRKLHRKSVRNPEKVKEIIFYLCLDEILKL